jgi:hypothetical protein
MVNFVKLNVWTNKYDINDTHYMISLHINVDCISNMTEHSYSAGGTKNEYTIITLTNRLNYYHPDPPHKLIEHIKLSSTPLYEVVNG